MNRGRLGFGLFIFFLFRAKPLAFYLDLELFWWKTVLWDFFMNYLMGKKLLLPLGFRFHPTDVELVMYYLKWKIMGKGFCFEAIAEVDIYKFAPWDLPDRPSSRSCDLKWYFFCPVEKNKYSNGARMNCTTEVGYWKIIGKGIIQSIHCEWLGDVTQLVENHYLYLKNTHVLCMIFQKDGLGPRNGAQYSAPFKEEDWNDDNEVNCVEAGPSLCFSTPTCVLPTDCNSSAITCTLFWMAHFLSHVYLKLWHLTARVFKQFPLMTLF